MPAEDRRRFAERIAARALAASKAPETEVLVLGGTEALTRFAGNGIHQNLVREGIEVAIRAADSGRTGRASTNRLDDEALAETAARALAIARRLEPRPDLLPVPEPYSAYPTTRCWDSRTADASPEHRARAVADVVDTAIAHGATAAGSITSDDKFEAVANSKGLFTYGQYTCSVLSLTMTTPGGSTGYAEDGSFAMGTIDARAAAQRAAGKAVRGSEQTEIPTGEYTTILEPVAVGELLFFLLYGHACSQFSGLAVREGQSYFTGKIGERVFGENITLRDDILHPAQWGVPFDAEGVPRSTVTLIDRGVVAGVTWDRATARAAGVEPTGHGLPLPNTYGSLPQNVVLEGGDQGLDEIIRTTRRGILVTRLWYNRLVDPADLIVTGLTRDGTFLIEDGAIVKGLRNYRINQSLRAMLNGVSALSPAVRAAAGIVAPALRVEEFRFAAVVPRDPS